MLVCSLAGRLFPTLEKLIIQSVSVCAFFASAAKMYRNPLEIQLVKSFQVIALVHVNYIEDEKQCRNSHASEKQFSTHPLDVKLARVRRLRQPAKPFVPSFQGFTNTGADRICAARSLSYLPGEFPLNSSQALAGMRELIASRMRRPCTQTQFPSIYCRAGGTKNQCYRF